MTAADLAVPPAEALLRRLSATLSCTWHPIRRRNPAETETAPPNPCLADATTRFSRSDVFTSTADSAADHMAPPRGSAPLALLLRNSESLMRSLAPVSRYSAPPALLRSPPSTEFPINTARRKCASLSFVMEQAPPDVENPPRTVLKSNSVCVTVTREPMKPAIAPPPTPPMPLLSNRLWQSSDSDNASCPDEYT
jgi:hypothetical protein